MGRGDFAELAKHLEGKRKEDLARKRKPRGKGGLVKPMTESQLKLAEELKQQAGLKTSRKSKRS